ncbi:MAG: VWA domain-containing protein [Rhodospirillales bacterium 20-60-12]|nr:MAG: VWA domain-containing protein [Rhodospirillales bacterium 20-60-12]HQT68135.1 nitric oxide reductase activation protein NorD [Acetobacteraceae bacterium]
MAISLDDYQDRIADLPEAAAEALRAEWTEVGRVFSSRGLENYLRSAMALHRLGRGEELVVAYLKTMPAVTRSLGEDVLGDITSFLLSMASKTSGSVLALICSTAPLAADRLADIDLFRGYLAILDVMLAQAPRGLRPILENLDRLFGQLTLGGLRRWVNWGAQAYKADFQGQVLYFGLKSPDALAVLQQERKGTLFVDIQRRLNIYLRAMWGRDFFLRPTAGDYESREGLRAYIDRYVIYIADAYDDQPILDRAGAIIDTLPALELYRAVINHCAAHLAFTTKPLSRQELVPVHVAVIEIIEDARVEELAIRQFPNMRAAWLALHPIPDITTPPARMGTLFARLAYALLDPDWHDPHPWVQQGVAEFRNAESLEDNQISWNIGVSLVHGLLSVPVPEYDPRRDSQTVIYRDDNRFVWQGEAYDTDEALAATWDTVQVRKKSSLMEMINNLDTEFAGDDAQEIWTLPTEYILDQEGVSLNQLEGKAPVAEPVYYPEWDYQIQLERPTWAAVLERQPPTGDLAVIERIVEDNKPVMARLRFLIETMVPQGMQRIRHIEDGDELDINAAIRAMIDIRTGHEPDPRVMIKSKRHVRDLAVTVLLDMSESSNDKVRGQDYTVLDLTRAATVMLASALDRIGDRFALQGFCSDGRHDVHFYRFKDFEKPYDDLVKARLAGMKGAYSTRMGAALRHAGHLLSQQRQTKKIIFMITDGEPADNDMRDPQYLRHDTRHAVEQLRRQGITTYAISLDPHADQYVSRIFGAKYYTVVDHIERLPERLPALYMGLTQ